MKTLFLILALLIPAVSWAADAKLSELDRHTDADGSELLYVVINPDVSPVSKAMLISELPALTEADTLNTVFARTDGNRIDGAIESKPLEVRGSGGGADDGWDFFTDSANAPSFVCVVGGVQNACDYYRLLADTKKFGVKDSAGNVEFEHTEDTGITAMTVNAETSGVTITLPEETWFEVASCQNTTAQLIFNTNTAAFPAATCEGTNTRLGTADFDADTDEGFDTSWRLPTGFTGAIDIIFRGKMVDDAGAVGLCAQLIRVPTGVTSDPAQAAQAAGNCVSITLPGTTLLEFEGTISGVTCTSCVAGDRVNVRISRDANGGAVTDSATGDYKMIGFTRRWRVAK